MSATNIYYIYAYLREDLTPYYIGKGSRYRINSKQRTIPIPPKDRRIKLVENLSEQDAYKLEEEFILKYGRIDLRTGCLRNMSNGGKGVSCPKGRVPWNKGKKEDPVITAKRTASLNGIKKSEKTKDKISKTKKGTRTGSDNHFYGKTHTVETRERISNAVKENWGKRIYS